ncbi:hypothetical protein Tco_0316436 [Tanacetum coccineum]
MCHIVGIEPQFENIIKNSPYIPMAAGQRKPEVQWTADERKAANLDQRLKSLIMFVLPDDQMNSVINCLTAKSTWDDLILYHEGPSDVKESRVIDLKLCHNTFKFKEEELFQDSLMMDEDTRAVGPLLHLKVSLLSLFDAVLSLHSTRNKNKDYLGKFDEKADDGYFLGYSLVSKGFRVFNTRKQQTEETYHITFDESTDPIKFSKSSVDNINIAESERYPPDEYIYHYEPSQKYQVNSNEVSFIDPYERPDSVVLETESPSDQYDQSDQNDHHAQENDIPNDNPPEHSNHNNDSPIIENLINAEMVQESEPTSSLVEDA